MGTLLFRTIMGGVAGFLAWLIWEPSAPTSFFSSDWEIWSRNYILTIAAFIGIVVGGLMGWGKGTRGHFIRGALLGLFFGVIGGGLGLSLANALEGVAGGHGTSVNPLQRLIELTSMGVCIGAGVGASTLSVSGIVQGLIGGTIAGAISGVSFDALSLLLSTFIAAGRKPGETVEIGAPGRALLGVLLGALIALFIGLAEALMRSAWVRLSLGKNEGKEWAVDRQQMLIGRSELAHIPLFGDQSIAPQHAYIVKNGNDYLLADPGGSASGVLLNGQRVNQQALLTHGSTIQIGNTVLQFLMRAGKAPAPVVDGRAYAQPGQQPGNQPGAPMPGGLNPYANQPTQVMPGQAMQPTQAMPGQGMPSQGYGAPGMQPTMMSPQMQPGQMQPGQMQTGQMQAGMQPTMMSPMPGQPQAGGLTLVALDGPLAGQRFPLGAGLELGRTSPNVPMSYDTEASRRHAMVSPTPTGASVQDIGSTNGTFVNNQRVQMMEARPGDLIRVGRTTFRLES